MRSDSIIEKQTHEKRKYSFSTHERKQSRKEGPRNDWLCALKYSYILNKGRAEGIWKETPVVGIWLVVYRRAMYTEVLTM